MESETAAPLVADTAGAAPPVEEITSPTSNIVVLPPIFHSNSSGGVQNDTLDEALNIAEERTKTNANPLSPRLQPISNNETSSKTQAKSLVPSATSARDRRRRSLDSDTRTPNSRLLNAVADAATDALSKIGDAMDSMLKKTPLQSNKTSGSTRRFSLDGGTTTGSSRTTAGSSKSERNRLTAINTTSSSSSKKSEAARKASGRRSAERKSVIPAEVIEAPAAAPSGVINADAGVISDPPVDNIGTPIDEAESEVEAPAALKRQCSTEVPDTMIFLSSLA